MSKPRKDSSTPSGSTPVDARAARDGAAGDAGDTTASSSTKATSAVKTPGAAKKSAKATPAASKGSKKKLDTAEELARRTTAQKVRVSGGDNPVWWVPLMVGFMVLGLLWLVVTYLAQGDYPAPKVGTVWNLGIGFVLVMAGFLMTTRWK
ncbi:cell division protein CrgA [Allobranchiibius huperziae]|uniref:Cell division protein CrgA n=1 Tax=Allobranchiibius huperziae TaxID=1874116 RepID=A0A853DFP6_9MICO|nr:cobalamin biosynthesis Mg chelatase CobN [Allobranchiibius huperziae]